MLLHDWKMLSRCFIVMPITGVLYFLVTGYLGYFLFCLVYGYSRQGFLISTSCFSALGLLIGTLAGIDYLKRNRRIPAFTSSELRDPKGWFLKLEPMTCPDDVLIEIVRNLRGIYKAGKREKVIVLTFVIFLIGAGPVLFLLLVMEQALPYSALKMEYMIYSSAILILITAYVLLYVRLGKSYEFTGESIIERNRSGFVLNVISIDTIKSILAKNHVFVVTAGNNRMKVYRYKRLRTDMRRIVERMP